MTTKKDNLSSDFAELLFIDQLGNQPHPTLTTYPELKKYLANIMAAHKEAVKMYAIFPRSSSAEGLNVEVHFMYWSDRKSSAPVIVQYTLNDPIDKQLLEDDIKSEFMRGLGLRHQ